MSKKDWQLLKAYQATGLTPEGVVALQKELEWKQMCLELAQRTLAQVEKEKPTQAVETNIYNKEETIEGCTVQILTNTATGETSVGWWRGSAADMPGKEKDRD